jgi:hypothetical protein
MGIHQSDSWDISGVMRARFPKQATITMTAYGVQMPAHRHTLVMATLAMRISALSALESCRK